MKYFPYKDQKAQRQRWFMLKSVYDSGGKDTMLFKRAYAQYVERYGKPGKEPPGPKELEIEDAESYFQPKL